MRIQVRQVVNDATYKLGLNDHCKHPLMMLLNLKKYQASSPRIFNQVYV